MSSHTLSSTPLLDGGSLVLPGHQQPLGTYQKRRFSGSAQTLESPTSPHGDSSASSDLENHGSRMDSLPPTLFHPLLLPPPPSFSPPWEQLHFFLATAGSESHHWVSEQPQECPCCHASPQPRPPPQPQSLLWLPGLPRLSPEEEEVLGSGSGCRVPERCTRAPAPSSLAWAGAPTTRLCLQCF